MIINEKGLARALKMAYKHGGYTIMSTEEQVTIYTEDWYLRADWDKFPRKALATIVEHMGTLPTSADALFIFSGDEPQVVMPESVGEIVSRWVNVNNEQRATIVPVMVYGNQLYQLMEGGNCYGVRPTSLGIVERSVAEQKDAIVCDDNRLAWSHNGENVVVSAVRPSSAYWAKESEKRSVGCPGRGGSAPSR